MKWILPVIVISQFFCTSLWFAGNAVMADIVKNFNLDTGFLAHLTSAVQLGFITGTFVFALLTVADRFSPSKVFFFSSIIAALFNLGMIINSIEAAGLLSLRFFTGFFLAGIYPVGMKIASDYYREGLGKSLGFLLGALVLGTALPHLLKNLTMNFPWKYVIFSTSVFAALGGFAMLLLVPNGPYRKPGRKLQMNAFMSGFRNKNFRAAAFGYFGHMWELYAFWAFVPVMLSAYNHHYPDANLDIPFLSFLVIGCGSLACIFSGLLSQRWGAKKVAMLALSLSFLCCLASPLLLFNHSAFILIAFLLFWGLVVIADSPMFSTLVAHAAPEETKGTSLTMVNCIGFSITIISIQLLNILSGKMDAQYIYMILAAGPALGLAALLRKK